VPGKALLGLVVVGLMLFGASFLSGWDSYRFDVIGYGAATGSGSHDAWKAELRGEVAAIPVLALASAALAAYLVRRRPHPRGPGVAVLGMTTAAAGLAAWAVSGGKQESVSERFYLVVEPGATMYVAFVLSLAMTGIALWVVARTSRREPPRALEDGLG